MSLTPKRMPSSMGCAFAQVSFNGGRSVAVMVMVLISGAPSADLEYEKYPTCSPGFTVTVTSDFVGSGHTPSSSLHASSSKQASRSGPVKGVPGTIPRTASTVSHATSSHVLAVMLIG